MIRYCRGRRITVSYNEPQTDENNDDDGNTEIQCQHYTVCCPGESYGSEKAMNRVEFKYFDLSRFLVGIKLSTSLYQTFIHKQYKTPKSTTMKLTLLASVLPALAFAARPGQFNVAAPGVGMFSPCSMLQIHTFHFALFLSISCAHESR
jgi:hypothetical protein